MDGYVETSALKGGEDVDRVFHQALKLGMEANRNLTSSGTGVEGPVSSKELRGRSAAAGVNIQDLATVRRAVGTRLTMIKSYCRSSKARYCTVL